MTLPDGLTKKHIEDAVNRGDHFMTYRGGIIDIDDLWKQIQPEKESKRVYRREHEQIQRESSESE